MSSSWSNKLETRLSALADSASKESLQTLAKWMGFNRKHRVALASALAGALKKAGPTRQWLYLQLAHEVCMLDIDDPKKWDRLADLRTTLGEMVVIPAVSALRGDGRVANLVEQWDNRNVFGGPTLLNQIRKAITDSPATVSSSAKSSSEATELASTVQGEEKKKPKAEAVQDTRKPQAEAPAPAESNAMAAEGTTAQTVKKEYAEANKTDKPAKTETPAKPNEEQVLPLKQEEKSVDLTSESNVATKSPSPTKLQQVKFDFEKEGIPYGKVDAREFQVPCKAIAALQITREIRNDTALQLSSVLSTVPENVNKICVEAKEEQDATGEANEISSEVIDEISMQLSEEVLDLDLEEMLQNIQTFREIVQKQRAARERLIHLLIQSRCQFGSNEAAESFYGLDDTAKLLQKRKELLLDAMALEGLDFEEPTNKSDEEESGKDLEPLSWYVASEKRARTE